MKKLSQFNDGPNIYKNVEFNLIRKDIRNLIIKVDKSNKIIVSIPFKVKDELLIKFLDENIEKFWKYCQEKEENNSINEKEKSFYLFGTKIFYEIDEVNKKIIIGNKKISIATKTIREAINSYRKKQLKVYLLIKQFQFQKLMNIEEHMIKVRDKSTAWATNHVLKKIIYYSTNLSSFSYEIIDYVIIHELCHNKHANHSKEFWKMVEKYDPKYKIKRYKLKKMFYL